MFDVSSDSAANSGISVSGPQPEYRISLTLSVADAGALWTAAAARLLAAPGMTHDDVVDVIGPCQDPSILECLTALACPTVLAGCKLDDFWIDSLKGCPPRLETLLGRSTDNLQSTRHLPIVRKLPPTLHFSR